MSMLINGEIKPICHHFNLITIESNNLLGPVASPFAYDDV
jgi:hypothetical protein